MPPPAGHSYPFPRQLPAVGTTAACAPDVSHAAASNSGPGASAPAPGAGAAPAPAALRPEQQARHRRQRFRCAARCCAHASRADISAPAAAASGWHHGGMCVKCSTDCSITFGVWGANPSAGCRGGGSPGGLSSPNPRNMFFYLGKSLRNLSESLRNLGKSLHNLGKSLHNLGKSLRNLGKSLHNLSKSLRNLGKSLRNLGKSLRNLGKSMQYRSWPWVALYASRPRRL